MSPGFASPSVDTRAGWVELAFSGAKSFEERDQKLMGPSAWGQIRQALGLVDRNRRPQPHWFTRVGLLLADNNGKLVCRTDGHETLLQRKDTLKVQSCQLACLAIRHVHTEWLRNCDSQA